MASSKQRVSRFRSQIRRLIAEIEACMHAGRRDADRECQFQTQAFQERCGQAEQLTSQLDAVTAKDRTGWSLRDGDAHRIHESLKLSLDYFSRDADQ
jgi:hypothetical protein